MKTQEALRQAKEFVTAQGGQVAPLGVTEEEINPESQDDLSLRAESIESMNQVYDVPYEYPQDSDCTEFRFFEDGRQRTLQIGYIRTSYGENLTLIPVHFFMVAAVVLERRERKLVLWRKPVVQQGVLVPKGLIPEQQILQGFEQKGLLVVDTDRPGSPPGDYYDIRRRALLRAKDQRLAVEQQLITEWRESNEAGKGFLIVDGTLMNMRDEKNVASCIGVSKSFGSRYFDISKHNQIMQMKACQRSWTFRFHDETDESDDQRKGSRERLSWYLRLRDKPNADPEFGLIRVEMSKSHIPKAGEFANRFSRSLLSERLPTAYPAPRWDKHLYPIQGCENYLSSIMPVAAR